MLTNLFVRNHGAQKHGSDYQEVVDAKNKGTGTVVNSMYRSEDNRTAEIIRIKWRRYGIIIWQHHGGNHFEIVTAFIKNKMKTQDKVEAYLQNQGYS